MTERAYAIASNGVVTVQSACATARPGPSAQPGRPFRGNGRESPLPRHPCAQANPGSAGRRCIGIVCEHPTGSPRRQRYTDNACVDSISLAIRLCARLEGILIDPMYERKSMHGTIDKVRLGEFEPGSKM